MARQWSPPEALAYTRWLATSHYENFHIVSFLLPKHLHQDFFNVYAFCRWADDLADETGNVSESLRLLDWWRTQLLSMFAGQASHPVFLALRDTVRAHSLPQDPFLHLIQAFVHDQTVTRYNNWDELFTYCRHSANPVGRLVLHLCGYSDSERQQLSDATCTALQLANFWQDVSIDLSKNRIYMPLDLLARHGCTVEDIVALRFTPAFRTAMRECVNAARQLFHRGLPLSERVDRRLSLDLQLFSRGGLRVLDKIARQNYNVLAQRPKIGKTERVFLLISTLLRWSLRRAA